MNPGLVIKLRPTGPWRIGPDSGARNRVDTIYHSDTLYAAVTGALARLGPLEDWLAATARNGVPAVCFSSCFPFLDEIGFIVPPRTVWPPTSPALLSARLRWKSARFVPLGIVQAILGGRTLDENHWSVDAASECLVPAGRLGPFRTGMRSNAAVDRLSGSAERHSTACIEFRAGAGLWTVVSFADEAAAARWLEPLKTAFRLLADSGFGGERSRGWGRSEMPEFIEGMLPEMILPAIVAAQPVPQEPPAPSAPPPPVEEPPAPPPVEEPQQQPEPPHEEPPAAEAAVRAPEAILPLEVEPQTAAAELPPSEPPAALLDTGAAAAPAPALEPPISALAVSDPIAEPPAAVLDTGAAAAPAPALEPPTSVSDTGAAAAPAPEPDPEPPPPDPEPAPAPMPPVPEPAPAPGPPDLVPPQPEPMPAFAAAPEPAPIPEPEPLPAPAEPPQPEPEPLPSPTHEPTPAPAALAEAPAPAPEPVSSLPPTVGGETHPHWLLSLFTPAASDTVDWGRGSYAVIARAGRIESPLRSGELKKQLPMVAEGSVLYAGSAPCGSAPDVAPDGFAHPVYRAGFALSIPLPEVS